VANENHSTHEILGGFGAIFFKKFDMNHAKVTLPHFARFHNFATLLSSNKQNRRDQFVEFPSLRFSFTQS
jgi:hypothetical protein